MATIAIGLEDIKLKLNGTTTGDAFFTSESIGEVMEGSTTLTQEAPAETKIKGDYSDATLFSLFTANDFTIETDIIAFDAEKWSALTGGTYTPGTKTISLPASMPILTGEIELHFKNGLNYLKVYKGQIVANSNVGNVKTEPYKLHLKIVALEDSGSYVDLVHA